ncbi:hypothetical protein NK718_13325 [Alsobacter sp. SYSU M60028]|uniref:Lipoprotein n=1 Tax=Alsobacter ponti TaxID=2962936 RepID=A0ABT1LEX0_9HYPH|nr:hypothetical protein [Alsobacter ponti]MCP8939501.1 hypothetical protein [Alsobacter ponti]
MAAIDRAALAACLLLTTASLALACPDGAVHAESGMPAIGANAPGAGAKFRPMAEPPAGTAVLRQRIDVTTSSAAMAGDDDVTTGSVPRR